jgi:hypothetical protein
MSRKWERMVRKNQENMNKQRQKTGQAPLGNRETTIKGRSWLFPLVLVLAGLMFAVTLPPSVSSGGLYQITIALYFVLALFHLLIRRPYLKIGKSELGWRTYTGEQKLAASEIASITISPSAIVIEGKNGKTRRKFSRIMQLFPMEELTKAVKIFASQNKVETKEG